MTKLDLRNYSHDELIVFFVQELGEKSYRGEQVFAWLYRHGVTTFNEMTNLSQALRDKLDERCTIDPLPITFSAKAEDGTEKLQFTLTDGNAVEAVLMPNEDRASLCLSSQVGCAMGCAFCYTGSLKLTRNLTAAEIVEQYRGALRRLSGDAERISNVVIMGMGEPLQNVENVAKACNLFMHDKAYDLSARRVTVSTSGLVPQISKLLNETRVNLAVSLNATTDEVRSRIMPVNKMYPLNVLLPALEALPSAQRQRLMLEYVLLHGVNDTLEDARRLKKIAHRLECKVNLIPFNSHDRSEFSPPPPDHVLRFQSILVEANIKTFIRQSRGQDIYGACGMLGRGSSD